MKFLIFIGVIVGLFIVIVAGVVLVSFVMNKWELSRHPDRDRQLSPAENAYIENAQAKLEQFAKGKSYKKPLNWLIYMAYLPVMVLVWGLGFVGYTWLEGMKASQIQDSAALGIGVFVDSSIAGVSMLFGIFGGILIAGWLTYFLTSFDKKFTSWMVLTQGSGRSESEDSVYLRRQEQIEADVRVRRLDIKRSFDPVGFLTAIARRHGHYCLLLSLPLILPMFVFLFLDFRNQTNFYEDGLSYTQYWSGKIIEVSYGDLDHVAIECAFGSKNRLNTRVHFVGGGENVASYDIVKPHLGPLFQIDDRLRTRGVTFKPHFWHPPGKDPRLAYLTRCVEKRVNQFEGEERKQISKILHASEGLSK